MSHNPKTRHCRVFLICGRTIRYDDLTASTVRDYEIYGVWEGYDEDSNVMTRSVPSLSNLFGQEYRLLYPASAVHAERPSRPQYASGPAMTFYRRISIAEIPIPAGAYDLEYEIAVFGHSILLDRIELLWDGKTLSFPEGFVRENP